MADNQVLNDSEGISFASTEISLSRTARFWILLGFDVPSTILTFFVLYCVFIDRKLRSNIKNHALIAILIFGMSTQLIDVPFYLNFIVHSIVVPSNDSICILWCFADIGMYNGATILLAWTSFERHILVFHDRWLVTRKKRILIHYIPLTILILYILIFNVYAYYFFPCENSYDYTLPLCNGSPCFADDPIMGMWDSVINTALPSILEAAFSGTFLFRVIWQKYRSRLPIQWRRQRKMTIQLLSLSSLNMAFNFPLSILNIAHLCGLPDDIGVEATQYFFFLCYFVIFSIPFICLASISAVKRKLKENVFRQNQQVRRMTATVRPLNFRTNMTVQY